jgi:hypothetical protein
VTTVTESVLREAAMCLSEAQQRLNAVNQIFGVMLGMTNQKDRIEEMNNLVAGLCGDIAGLLLVVSADINIARNQSGDIPF